MSPTSEPRESLLLECDACKAAVVVVGTAAEVVMLLAEDKRCMECGGSMPAVETAEQQPMLMTALEAFLALVVRSLAANRFLKADPPTVERVLEGSPIQQVVTHRSDERVVVDRLVLADGHTLHIGPSTKGAVVYKVTGGPT